MSDDFYTFCYNVVIHFQNILPYETSSKYFVDKHVFYKGEGEYIVQWEKYSEFYDNGYHGGGCFRLHVRVGFDDIYDIYKAKRRACKIAEVELKHKISQIMPIINETANEMIDEDITIDGVEHFKDEEIKALLDLPKHNFKNSCIHYLIKKANAISNWLNKKVEYSAK